MFHSNISAARSRHRVVSGFTRIQLLVGVATVAVVATIAVPSLMRARQNSGGFRAPLNAPQAQPIVLAATQSEAAPDAPAPRVAATNLPVEVAPSDPNLRYVGRFDTSDAGGPSCAWPASSVEVHFRGTALNALLSGNANVHWQIEVDGEPTRKIALDNGDNLYSLAENLAPGEHRVRLVQATEASVGTTQLRGFQLNEGAQLLPVATNPRRLEVIGDSISAGYGNEAASKDEHFSAATENAYFAYGAIAARRLDADYVCVAWSGKKMWPDNTLPELYDFVLPADKSGDWKFKTAPDAVVINLSTNDFAQANPEKEGWIAAYKTFVERVRAHYPRAMIYCATSPMMGDWGPGDKPLTTSRAWLARVAADEKAKGDERVKVVDLGSQNSALGYGADWHPNVKNQQIIAGKLAQALSDDLGWQF